MTGHTTMVGLDLSLFFSNTNCVSYVDIPWVITTTEWGCWKWWECTRLMGLVPGHQCIH